MSAPTLSEIRQDLLRDALEFECGMLHERACVLWFARPDELEHDIGSVAMECATTTDAGRETQHVSALGYAFSLYPKFKASFVEGVDWLMRRRYFVPGRPVMFENDGVGLLGVALGIVSLNEDERSARLEWLHNIIAGSNFETLKQDWNVDLMIAASEISGMHVTGSTAVSDLVAALAERRALINSPDRDAVWRLVTDQRHGVDGPTRAAVRVAALDWVSRTAATLARDSLEVADVANILEAIAHRSFRRWPWEAEGKTRGSAAAKWVVDNEYHVQAILLAILAPIFPDLDDEEYLQSIGQKHPRADFVIPSLDLVIEVKFARATMTFAKVIEEVAADASLYFSKGSSYQHMLVFVWDDASRTQFHAELKQGIMRLPNVVGVSVMPRPSHMVRVATAVG